MRRVSTYSAFLPQSLAESRKSHLRICTHALVSRVVFQVNAGEEPKTIGVEFKSSNPESKGTTFFAKTRREVILCCGAFGSPQVLMLRYSLILLLFL
jgi:choline dehydrogenase-like flavoprotein